MKPGRNDPCPCGSGKKYKKCCGDATAQKAPASPKPGLNISQALQTAWQLFQSNQLQRAGAIYQQVLQIDPDNTDALNLLSGIASKLGKFDRATELLRRAVAIKPDSPDYHNNLGYLLQIQRHPGSAITHYKRALELKPDYEEAHLNLANAYRIQGRIDKAISHYKKAINIRPDYLLPYTNLLLALNCSSNHTPMDIFQAHLDYAERFAKPLEKHIRPFDQEPDPEKRLRIGYISADFKIHSVAYFLLPVFANHNHDNFEIFSYYNHRRKDAATKKLEDCSDHWRDIVAMPDDKVADIIYHDKIDILVDLSGHTADNRLLVFARKPAPIQTAWIGYPGTTGLSTMDYRITDNHTDPEGETDSFYAEKLIRLPDCFSCYQPPESCPDVSSLPALNSGFITFGSFNNFAKVTSEVMALWARILQTIPNSRLMLKASGLDEPEQQEYIQNIFSRNGISAERLELLGSDPTPEEHLQRYSQIDIGLDPFPYNGTTTTCEALWMGVPVITLTGSSHQSRVGTSILSNTGATRLIADTLDNYVNIAKNLAGNIEELRSLRLTLRERMAKSVLMDAPRFTRHLESAYRKIWKQWCKA